MDGNVQSLTLQLFVFFEDILVFFPCLVAVLSPTLSFCPQLRFIVGNISSGLNFLRAQLCNLAKCTCHFVTTVQEQFNCEVLYILFKEHKQRTQTIIV